MVVGLSAAAVGFQATFFTAAASPGVNGKDPVILVHGMFGSPSNWDTLKSKLKASGYTDDQLITFGYNSTSQSNVTTSEKFAAKVDEVLAATGASKVDVVGHSMGSLNSRYCVKYTGCAGKVDDWVSLAGPNNGSANAGLGSVLITAREMIPGSEFLERLNAGASLPPGVSGTTIWSPSDGVVMPANSTVLPGLNNIEVAGVTHLGMLRDNAVAGLVATALA
ncbi:triacylglycerol lipase [Herbihabitans rhizosphaerae]|uniref:Triacylglycerol lipase n=1 Tax=Herbihabitans rhizosphaerae TaxID=1872711 RepID=A0A4Q7L6J9_9PSEU|nr:triacylglycerol lipase [Herbihabitans rhizosphaerae]RZS44221.1 triacylglycerol lipase [Herbihabitans rhizosphaerae]